mgnify:CR=1 FL=1
MKISDLRTMRIVNMADGKILGKISDLVMDVNRGYVKAIIMPGDTKWPVFWSSEREVEVPWENIKSLSSICPWLGRKKIKSKKGIFPVRLGAPWEYSGREGGVFFAG